MCVTTRLVEAKVTVKKKANNTYINVEVKLQLSIPNEVFSW